MKTRTALRLGLRPEGAASTHRPELAPAARRLAEAALEELKKAGVTVELDKAGRAHFHSRRISPLAARLTIERSGDGIEALLQERANGRGRESESN